MLKNLEVLISWSEKSIVITKSFESYIELVSYSLEIPNESTSEKISVNELEKSSRILSAGRCDNYNINYYSGKSAKIVKNSNSDSNSSPGFSDEGKKETMQP